MLLCIEDFILLFYKIMLLYIKMYIKGCIDLHKVRVSPQRLKGTVSVPPSKSAAHRAIICASLAKGRSLIRPIDLSNDISATIDCMKNLGADISLVGDTLVVDGTDTLCVKKTVLDCGESGSTLRFLIPVAAVGGVETAFVGHGKLPERPIGVYTECMPDKGVYFSTKKGLPLEIKGRLRNGIYEIPGNISSQFITGLMLALPLLDGDSEIRLTSKAQSAGYIEMTVDIMNDFGVHIEKTALGWKISGGQKYVPQEFTVEGDWSHAAFYMTAAALGSEICIDNLSMTSSQGDKECVEIYRRFGAEITENNGKIMIRPDKLIGIEIDAENIPDMVPALSVAAALAKGRTVIKGAARLRIKECDRLAAMTDGLSRLGANIVETEDGLIIDGADILHGGEVEGYNDHRIVMSLAMAAVGCNGDIIISDMESVNKSYPSFFEDYKKLGGKADVIMG